MYACTIGTRQKMKTNKKGQDSNLLNASSGLILMAQSIILPSASLSFRLLLASACALKVSYSFWKKRENRIREHVVAMTVLSTRAVLSTVAVKKISDS